MGQSRNTLRGIFVFWSLGQAFLQAQSTGLAQSSWPSFRFDAGHRARATVQGPDAATYQKYWTVDHGFDQNLTPVLAPNGGLLFTSNTHGCVFTLDHKGEHPGTLFCLNSEGYFTVPPLLGSDGTIYLGSTIRLGNEFKGRFYAITPTGEQRWRYPKRQDERIGSINHSATIDHKGNVLVVADDCLLYSFNPNGGLNWIGDLAGEKPSHAVAVDTLGYIYAPAGKNVYVFHVD